MGIRIVGTDVDKVLPFLHLIESDRDVTLFIDTPTFFRKGLTVYLQLEPLASFDAMKIMRKNFDYVLRRDPKLPHEILCLPCESWVKPELRPKPFLITHMAGGKQEIYGQRLRRHIFMNQLKYAHLPMKFWRSSALPLLPNINDNPLLENKVVGNHLGMNRGAKGALFDAQFSLVIENSREINYFSEKLLDCLLSRTVPVYFGCPNIQEYFDTRGWILLLSTNPDDVEQELLQKLGELEETSYAKSPVEDNFKRALKYADFAENVVRALVQIPGIRRVIKA
jgi:hypothetical protein